MKMWLSVKDYVEESSSSRANDCGRQVLSAKSLEYGSVLMTEEVSGLMFLQLIVSPTDPYILPAANTVSFLQRSCTNRKPASAFMPD